MPSTTRVSLAVAIVSVTLWAGAASAAVQCPPTSGGHPLRASGSGDLYEGPVENAAILAPDGTRQGPGGWVNTWTFKGSANGITLVCRYEGTRAVERVKLTAETKGCRQDVRSFVCR